MSIIFDSKEQVFLLNTPETTYAMSIYGDKHLLHLYYGKRIKKFFDPSGNLPVYNRGAFSATDIPELKSSTDVLPSEYPCFGSADLRTPAFHAEYENGSSVTKLEYEGYEISKGKKPIPGLPATYVESEYEADTLQITLRDKLTDLEITLFYSVFNNFDAIAKSVKIKNRGNSKINIKTALSSTTYLFDKDYDFVHLEGNWARERSISKEPLINGIIEIGSKRGSSSHFHSPFLALSRPNATETSGDVFGFAFVYSGNHIEQAEVNGYDVARINIGINPFGFNWLLEPGEEFYTPEVILTYSDEGFGKMSRTFHKLFRSRLIRGKFRDSERPVLINNWEATYFNFNEEKILDIAKKAESVGVELMVLDDGWFGKRNSDNCSLGDWTEDRNKLPGGLKSLAGKINEMGMSFGLWFEPEMISEESELFKAHPDWCIHTENREKSPSRNQFVLDLSRKEVCDYIVEAVSRVLSSAPVSYVKWDMNRNISEAGSAVLPSNRQQEILHRYMLGLYDILERITTAFPDVLFEGCSGGGGRFDPGMLYYFPQYWTSDNTDAVERIYIQHGTSMLMPSSAMGAHISAVPNHQLGRTTSLEIRGHVAMNGQFGYELDLNNLSDEEISEVKEQIILYKSIREVIHKGEMFRLKSPYEGINAAWEYLYNDTLVLMFFTLSVRCGLGKTCVKFRGLDENAEYTDIDSGKVYDGSYLMNVGLYFENRKEFSSKVLIFKKK